jgi:hypothetical protein
MSTVLQIAERGAHWRDIGNKTRDLARTGHKDIDEYLMHCAHVAWARGDEADAIRKVLENETFKG